MKHSLTDYRTFDTLGKSQIELILQVYDGAIASFTAARRHFENGDHQMGREQIEKSRKFITHLYTTLNPDKGGDIAEQLGKLYAFVLNQTNVIEATKDTNLIDEVISVLDNLRQGWLEIKTKVQNSENGSSRKMTGVIAGDFSISG